MEKNKEIEKLITKDLNKLGNYSVFKEVKGFKDFINFFQEEEGVIKQQERLNLYNLNNLKGLRFRQGGIKRYFCAKCGNIGTYNGVDYGVKTTCPNCSSTHLNVDFTDSFVNKILYNSFYFKDKILYYQTLEISINENDRSFIETKVYTERLCTIKDNGDIVDITDDEDAIKSLESYYTKNLLKKIYDSLENLDPKYKKADEFLSDGGKYFNIMYLFSNDYIKIENWEENEYLLNTLMLFLDLRMSYSSINKKDFEVLESYESFIKNFDKDFTEEFFKNKQMQKVFKEELLAKPKVTVDQLVYQINNIANEYKEFLKFSKDTYQILKHTVSLENRTIFILMKNILFLQDKIKSDFNINIDDEMFNSFYLENYNILGLGTNYYRYGREKITNYDLLDNLYFRIKFLYNKNMDINLETLKNKNFNKIVNFNELGNIYGLPADKVIGFDFLMDTNPLEALNLIKNRRQLNSEELEQLKKGGLLNE